MGKTMVDGRRMKNTKIRIMEPQGEQERAHCTQMHQGLSAAANTPFLKIGKDFTGNDIHSFYVRDLYCF